MFEDGYCYKQRARSVCLVQSTPAEVARAFVEELIDGAVKEIRQTEQNMRRMQHVIEEREAREVALLDQYNCPLTLDLMEDPVIASDGYTLTTDRYADSWKANSAHKSPKTNLPLEHTNLHPQPDLQQAGFALQWIV